MKKNLLNFLADESGSATARYSLIAVFITMAVAAAITGVGANLNTMLVSTGTHHHTINASE